MSGLASSSPYINCLPAIREIVPGDMSCVRPTITKYTPAAKNTAAMIVTPLGRCIRGEYQTCSRYFGTTLLPQDQTPLSFRHVSAASEEESAFKFSKEKGRRASQNSSVQLSVLCGE